jgi:phosphinothricin acetyltransferase
MEHSIHLTTVTQGRGLGRALMQTLEDHARAQGVHVMVAGVSSDNPAGQAFHARLGYAECGRVMQAGYKWGRYFDLVLMQKILT